jgi:hypothetical protein
MHTDLQTPTAPGPEPEGLVARARAAHVQALEQRRLEHEAARQRFREEATELLRRRLVALGVKDPAVAWDLDAGAVAVVEGLEFGLDDDDALVLGRPCPRCSRPMVSSPIEDLDDLGALLEREGDWPGHACLAAEGAGPAAPRHRPPLRPVPDDVRRAALWKLHHDTAVRAADAAGRFVEVTRAPDQVLADSCWDVLVEASAAHQAIGAALGLTPAEGARP